MAFPVFDKLRLFLRNAGIQQHERMYLDNQNLADFAANTSHRSSRRYAEFLEQAAVSTNRIERYRDYYQMSGTGEISLALDMYADEASLIDFEKKHSFWISSKSSAVKKELEQLFYKQMMLDDQLRPLTRSLCMMGDFAAEIKLNRDRDGVEAILPFDIENFVRVELENGDLVGYFCHGPYSDAMDYYHPWQCVHIRLLDYNGFFRPYGRSILEGARKHFRQLRLMEDAAIVYRLTRSPMKRIITIPVGHLPAREIEKHIDMVAAGFKKKRAWDFRSNDISEQWSPHIQEDDFFLPQRPDGTGPKIDTLPGADNLDQIADIEYFKKKMIAGLKIPFSRVGIGDTGEDSKQSLSQVAPEFAKAIVWIQRQVAIGLKKIGCVHLALRGYSAEDIRDWDIHMTASSAIDELYRHETWKTRADTIDSLKNTELFTEKFLVAKFTDLTEDEIEALEREKKLREEEGEGEEGEEGGGDVGDVPGLFDSLESETIVEGKEMNKEDKYDDNVVENKDGVGYVSEEDRIIEREKRRLLAERLEYTTSKVVRKYRVHEDNSGFDYMNASNEFGGMVLDSEENVISESIQDNLVDIDQEKIERAKEFAKNKYIKEHREYEEQRKRFVEKYGVTVPDNPLGITPDDLPD